jgi:hypothetical protein
VAVQRHREKAQQALLASEIDGALGIRHARAEPLCGRCRVRRPDQCAGILKRGGTGEAVGESRFGGGMIPGVQPGPAGTCCDKELVALADRRSGRLPPADLDQQSDFTCVRRRFSRLLEQLERKRAIGGRFDGLEQDRGRLSRVSSACLDHTAEVQQLRPQLAAGVWQRAGDRLAGSIGPSGVPLRLRCCRQPPHPPVLVAAQLG